MPTWKKIAKTADLAVDSACVVKVGTSEIALARSAEGFFALDNTCPHTGGPLGEGMVEGNTITCPLHAWQFDCKTGRCLSEKRPDQRHYAVKVEGQDVLLEMPDAPKTAEEWVRLCDLADLKAGEVKTVQAAGLTLAVGATAEGPFATDNACPHEGGPLGEGSIEGNTITCPLHGFKFDCKSGACLTESKFKAKTYAVRVEGEKLLLQIPKGPAARPAEDPSTKKNAIELWKAAKHGLDVWPDILRHAQEATHMDKIDKADLERMKWHGFFYRKNNDNNHYMIRVRIPGCDMSAEQARTLAFVAYEAGYSLADVTTRGNVQIQGLTIEKLPGVRAALERVGLTSRQSGHDNIRNITSHPLSGIDPQELIDTRELARQLQAMIVDNREFSDLPRKFNLALTGRAATEAHCWTQDLTFVAAWGPDAQVGFQVILGGSQGQTPRLGKTMGVFVRPDQVLEMTAAVLRTFRELGWRHNRHQVRMHFLIDRIGEKKMLEEVEKRLGYPLERCARPIPHPDAEEDYVGWFSQRQQDLWALGVCVPLGRLTWDQLEGLALIAQDYGWGSLRTTYDQNLILPGIPTRHKTQVAYAVARHGLTFAPDNVTKNTVSCTGKQFCNLAVTETKGYVYQLMEELRRRKVQLHGINIHASGCPSSCGMTYTGDIGLKGSKVRRGLRVVDAFDVYLGGGLGDAVQMGILYQKNVPVKELPEFLQKVIGEFYAQRSNQTFSEYWRAKLANHKAAAAGGEIPRWQCTHCGYLCVAADPPAFCPVCSALRARFEPAGDPDMPVNRVIASTFAALSTGSAKQSGSMNDKIASGATHPRNDGTSVSHETPMPSGKRIVIVGGSIGGHTAAQAARELDPECRITLITDEEHSFYNRLNLTRYLAQEVRREELFDYSPQWYEEHRVEVRSKTRAIGLDPIKKTVLLDEGRELAYDACILTHGSSAHCPPFYRQMQGVYLLRTLEDVEGILAGVQPGVRVGVIGGGVLGLEAAYGAVKRGAEVKVFEYLPHLMPRQLDKRGAAMFEAMVLAKGIEPHAGVAVQALIGEDKITGLALADGRAFDVDLLIVSTGIKPNIDWVKRSGIHCERGVVVDDTMQTSAPGVFAAGDVVQWRDQVVGLWTNAIDQAKVAAAGALGKEATFKGFLPVTTLKCLGISLTSIGHIAEPSESVAHEVEEDPAAGTYRNLILKDGIPTGAILLGTIKGMGQMRKRILEGSRQEPALR